ncbi:hypothetical protein CY35_02G154400 [Sphagnum magellanicum]|nr:hypothetical protein CY35_02G154400 [Sphagnum magellanicum]
MGRPLQAMESRLQMLRRLTMNQRVPLAPLVQITSHLNDVQLEQCVNNAIRNALYRLWMQAPDVQALREVDILVTLGDFLWALADMNR